MSGLDDRDKHLDACAGYLRAAICGEKVVLNTTTGLRCFSLAAAPDRLLDFEVTRQAVAETARLFRTLAPILSPTVADHLPLEHVRAALAYANDAMGCHDIRRRLNQLAYVAVLAAELEAIYYRDCVAGGEKEIALVLARNWQSGLSSSLAIHSVH